MFSFLFIIPMKVGMAGDLVHSGMLTCSALKRPSQVIYNSGRVFDHALNSVETRGRSTLSFLFANYEVHLELIKRRNELDLRLRRATHLAPRPDAPMIQNNYTLQIIQELRERLYAKHSSYRKVTLSMEGIIAKDVLQEQLAIACWDKERSKKLVARDLAYFAAIGGNSSSSTEGLVPLEIFIR